MNPLTCVEARSMVSDYIDGDLPPAVAHSLERHLETCPNCPPLHAALVRTLAELKALGDNPEVDALADRVLAAIDLWPPTGDAPPPGPGTDIPNEE